MQILKRLSVAAASGALILSTASPALGYNITIGTNGADSVNYVSVSDTSTDSVGQSNGGDISTTIDSDADTGDNIADENTGGNVSILTGNADVTNEVTTVGHLNGLTTSCGCVSGSDSTITVTGNGDNSQSTVGLGLSRTRVRSQGNTGSLTTNIDRSRGRTGGNRARRNTNGTVSVDTGDADVQNTVDTTGHENSVTEL